MRLTLSGFLKGFVPILLLGILAVALLRSMGYLSPKAAVDDPQELVREATENLEAVRRRRPGDRRPASYDSVMAPLDKLLQATKKLLENESYDPVADFDKMRSLTLPVIDIATQADRQARGETDFLVKEYRFNAQKGEASQYLANAMWERVNRRLPARDGVLDERAEYPAEEMTELRRVLNQGLEAAPENRELWYIRGVVNRAEGLFAVAAKDLERAVELDRGYVAAWNTLGLVRISLKEFDQAEEALERARAISLDAAKQFSTEPGAEYAAVVYNLAMFHEGLASFYNRENRIAPSAESQRLSARHASEARRHFEEFLKREPSDSADAKSARARLQALPGDF